MPSLKTLQSFGGISANANLVRWIVAAYDIDIANAHRGIIYERMITKNNKG